MAKFKDLLSGSSMEAATRIQIIPGAVLLGPMPNVDHEKFYVIAGINEGKVCVCSVIINSNINPFILKRRYLLERQLELDPGKYSFLSHKSYINCAQPLQGSFDFFQNPAYKNVGSLDTEDLKAVQHEIIASGMLTEEEIDMFFAETSE